ncbi:clostripain-related cysteine peptidase [Clostridium sp.]|uniref:clostripain-related cysteine peptidase n=1 Tax=Clostridium sp. TaxID=1506 RepID=UPI002FCC3E2C
MNIKDNKEWTILIYADGNNEMEDVIYNSFNTCTSSYVGEDTNVVIEIGLLGKINSPEGKWCGVRRYCINCKDTIQTKYNDINNYADNTSSSSVNPIFLEDLGNHNMADPNNLFNFISWGMKTYPAEHCMVILSGHGTDFVGCLTDLSFSNHYIMGIPEMAKAIYLGSKSANSIIDILVLDMCFMNSIEIVYEFSQYTDFIKTMITYTNFAPYEGLNYKRLIEFMACNSHTKDLNKFITLLIDTLKFSLTAYRLDKTQLDKIKQTLSDLGLYYLTKHSKVDCAYKSTEQNQIMDYLKESHCEELKKINNVINSIIIHCKTKFMGLNSSIKITSEDVSALIFFYSKLTFSKNNYWTKLLSNLPIDEEGKNINKVKVRTINSTTSTIHYILPLNSV